MSIIPYDFFAGLLMLLLFVSLFIIVTVVIIKRRVTKLNVTVIVLQLAILIGIPVVGHTEWNRNLQLQNIISTFQVDEYLPDTIAPEFIQTLQEATRPLQVNVVSSTKDSEREPDQVYHLVIDLEGDLYKVRLVSYTYPLSWSPYETWAIESIQKQ